VTRVPFSGIRAIARTPSHGFLPARASMTICTTTCSTVERQFEIVGEALAQLKKADRDLAARLPDAGNAIGFRNVLIHGYAKVDHAIVWQAAMHSLPKLRSAVDALLGELGDVP
jgi:uncharacterized protein with HEPN domain